MRGVIILVYAAGVLFGSKQRLIRAIDLGSGIQHELHRQVLCLYGSNAITNSQLIVQ